MSASTNEILFPEGASALTRKLKATLFAIGRTHDQDAALGCL